MTDYCITAAKPKGQTSHLNSQFYLWKKNALTGQWEGQGWKKTNDISNLISQGHSVLTGKVQGGSLKLGSPVEIELRISTNKSEYKISDMPDTV